MRELDAAHGRSHGGLERDEVGVWAEAGAPLPPVLYEHAPYSRRANAAEARGGAHGRPLSRTGVGALAADQAAEVEGEEESGGGEADEAAAEEEEEAEASEVEVVAEAESDEERGRGERGWAGGGKDGGHDGRAGSGGATTAAGSAAPEGGGRGRRGRGRSGSRAGGRGSGSGRGCARGRAGSGASTALVKTSTALSVGKKHRREVEKYPLRQPELVELERGEMVRARAEMEACGYEAKAPPELPDAHIDSALLHIETWVRPRKEGKGKEHGGVGMDIYLICPLCNEAAVIRDPYVKYSPYWSTNHDTPPGFVSRLDFQRHLLAQHCWPLEGPPAPPPLRITCNTDAGAAAGASGNAAGQSVGGASVMAPPPSRGGASSHGEEAHGGSEQVRVDHSAAHDGARDAAIAGGAGGDGGDGSAGGNGGDGGDNRNGDVNGGASSPAGRAGGRSRESDVSHLQPRMSERQLMRLLKAQCSETGVGEEPTSAKYGTKPGTGDGVCTLTVRHVQRLNASEFLVEWEEPGVPSDVLKARQVKVLRRTYGLNLPGLDDAPASDAGAAPAASDAPVGVEAPLADEGPVGDQTLRQVPAEDPSMHASSSPWAGAAVSPAEPEEAPMRSTGPTHGM